MSPKTALDDSTVIRRHPLTVRITHWVNVLCVLFLLPSGLQIFNAHPALYFGHDSDFAHPALAVVASAGEDGVIRNTIELRLGSAPPGDGFVAPAALAPMAFPEWATLPAQRDLATGRRWHFFFAWLFVINGAVYLIYAMASGHSLRALIPRPRELARIGHDILDHVRLRFRHGSGYNTLQKLAYVAVAFVILPAIVLSGWAMSPGMNAAFPWLVDVFAGRQTARTVHFVCAALLALFVLVHVAMVVASGPFRSIHGMITGRVIADRPRSPQ